MSITTVVFTLHGMGEEETVKLENIEVEIRKLLTPEHDKNVVWKHLKYFDHFEKVDGYWNDTKQIDDDIDSESLITKIIKLFPMGKKFIEKNLRYFILTYFADAIAYINRNSHSKHDVYSEVHESIVNQMSELLKSPELKGIKPENLKIVFLAHSLGSYVLWNHINDIKNSVKPTKNNLKSKPGSNKNSSQKVAWSTQQSELKKKNKNHDYFRLINLKTIVSFGSNIPLFIGNMPDLKLEDAFTGKQVIWHNYYDNNDPFGFPLTALNKPLEKKGVAWPMDMLERKKNSKSKNKSELILLDHKIKVGSMVSAHIAYMQNKKFLLHVVEHLDHVITDIEPYG